RDKLVEDGVNVDIITLNRIRPIPEDAINEAMERKNILFFEEGSKYGGVAERFSSILMTKGYKGNVNITAVEEEFVTQSSVDSALAKYKLDTNGIVNTVKSFLKGNNE
ncbi:MAG: 1-deoxy-D-xylulose-5-phosphate synthase, partial [Clostridia bacterium]|nr:1-deoxy-D-xylulose-5-phosphate synthase [Clostridia bacterium]